MKLSIVIPAYNEELRIIPALDDYYKFFEKMMPGDYQIVVVPNNCNDRTMDLVSNFAENKNSIRIIEIKGYVGKGGAVMHGFTNCASNYIGFTDADGSTGAKEFYKLFDNISDNEGIIGSRKLSNSIIDPERKPIDKFFSNVFSYVVVRKIINLEYNDTQCGAKIFSNELAYMFCEKVIDNGWTFDINLLLLAKKHEKKIVEYPIKWTDKDNSKLNIIDGILATFRLLYLYLKM